MTDRKLTIIGIAAAVMLTLAVVQWRVTTQRITGFSAEWSPLIQGLDAANIARIEIGAGEDPTVLQRQGDGFIVVNQNKYPASIEKMNNLITSILEMQAGQILTDDPARHEDLKVTTEKDSDLVRFLDANDQLIVGVVIGKRDYKIAETYVRKLTKDGQGDNLVYIAKKAPWIQPTPMDYIEERLLPVDNEEVQRVTIVRPEGTYDIQKDDQDKLILQAKFPPGKQAKPETEYEKTFTILKNLRFKNVQKENPETEKFEYKYKYICELADSTVCTFEIEIQTNLAKAYVKCYADFPDDQKVVKENRVESEEELKAKEAKLLARQAAKDFTDKHAGWIYEIPVYKANLMSLSLDNLTEDIPQPPQPDTQSTQDDHPMEPHAHESDS